jgi:hypothetical protein
MSDQLAKLLDNDALDLKRKYLAAKEHDPHKAYMYVVEAIGRLPDDPPPWAILACVQHNKQLGTRAETGNKPDKAGRLMDAVLRYQLAHYIRAVEVEEHADYKPISPTSAIMDVLRIEGWDELEDANAIENERRKLSNRFLEERTMEAKRLLRENPALLAKWRETTGETDIKEVAKKFVFPVEYGMEMTPRAERILWEQNSHDYGAPNMALRLQNYLGKLAG